MTLECDWRKMLTRLTIGEKAIFVGGGVRMYKGSDGFASIVLCW